MHCSDKGIHNLNVKNQERHFKVMENSMWSNNSEGQCPLNCQICEEEPLIQWKCSDCKMFMCEICKVKIHPKFTFGKDHTIINIKDIKPNNEQSEASLDFTNIKCSLHDNQPCCLYCKLCDQVICPRCVASTHNKHDLAEISEGYDIKVENLKITKANLQLAKVNMDTKTEKLENIKIAEQESYTKILQEIATQEKSLKDAVEKYAKNAKSDLEKKWESVQTSIEEEKSRFNEMKIELDEKINKVEEIIDTKNSIKFFQAEVNLSKSTMQSDSIANQDVMTIQKFIPGNISQSNIGIFEGDSCSIVQLESADEETQTLEQIVTENKSQETQTSEQLHPADNDNEIPKSTLKVMETYTSSLHYITYMSPCTNETIWLSSGIGKGDSKGNAQRIHIWENDLTVLNSCDVDICGISQMKQRQNYLFVSLYNKTNLFQLDASTGRMTKTQYNVYPLFPTAVHVSYEFVIVGAVNQKYPKHGRRVVIFMNFDGKRVKEIEFDNGTPLFTYPESLTYSKNSNLFVIDYLAYDNQGYRVVMVEPNERINTYYGHPSINSFQKQFNPGSIVSTPSNNIIILDTGSNTLHVINNNGDVMTYISLEEMGIPNGHSLGCLSDHIYIGCRGDEELGSKLYKINIKGCQFDVKCIQ